MAQELEDRLSPIGQIVTNTHGLEIFTQKKSKA
jgi:hypothetical protein